MSAHSLAYPRRARALEACREALRRGFLTQSGNHFAFGRRLFHPQTVRTLIDNGEAVRIGAHIVAWRPA